jgi:hypothetical protein
VGSTPTSGMAPSGRLYTDAVKGVLLAVLGAVVVAVVAGVAIANRGTSEGTDSAAMVESAPARCEDLAAWRDLANRIDAPVYCPGWVPSPLTAELGGPWNNIRSVDPDRSYLIGFVWQENALGGNVQEVHVNLRGYPGSTRIPTCQDVTTVAGVTRRKSIPCFQDPNGTVRANGIAATMYTVNHGADSWHVLLAWKRGGSLYSLSEHVAAPLTYAQVIRNLKHMLRSLVLVRPGA